MDVVQQERKPHTRGDEPPDTQSEIVSDDVNPTHVGMNRRLSLQKVYLLSKPHTRGDEPEGLAMAHMMKQ